MLMSFLRLNPPPTRAPGPGRAWAVRAWVWIMGAVLLLAGCSAVRFAYNQAPDLAYWWFDNYIDFNEQQAPQARQAINAWFDWHRRTQLPDYIALLQRAERDVSQNLTSAQMCRWWSDVEQRREPLMEHAVAALGPVVATLAPEQIANIERRYVKTNRDFRKEYLQEDPQERRKASIKRVADRSEMLYGSFDESQRELVARLLAGSPFDPQRWDAERRRRQQDILRTLRQLQVAEVTPDQGQQVLQALSRRLLESPDEDYRRYWTQLVAYNCEFAAQVHNSTTPAQRQYAVAKLKGWESDLKALAADRR